MLEQIFLKVLDMSRAASMIIVVVFFVRILLKRFPSIFPICSGAWFCSGSVMGIFRPRIYLPGNLRQEEQEYIILHEKFHNCGVADLAPIGEPTMVAEDVVMVWTDLALNNYPQPGAEDIAMAWTGGLRYDMEHDDIAELGDIYPKHLNNTVIQKADGSYWVCGENVGTEEKTVHGREADYTIVCAHEFHPCR